jgi:hypothetical protein
MRTPQKINTYSFGIVLGLSIFSEIKAITILRITLVIEERTEAATCSIFVMRIIVVIEEQKVLTSELVYNASILLLQ